MASVADDVTCSSFQLWEKTAFAAQPSAYVLKIIEKDLLVTCPDGPIHSLRLDFKEKGADGTFRPGRGAMEAAQWHSVYDGLCCEHYLLNAAHQHNIVLQTKFYESEI